MPSITSAVSPITSAQSSSASKKKSSKDRFIFTTRRQSFASLENDSHLIKDTKKYLQAVPTHQQSSNNFTGDFHSQPNIRSRAQIHLSTNSLAHISGNTFSALLHDEIDEAEITSYYDQHAKVPSTTTQPTTNEIADEYTERYLKLLKSCLNDNSEISPSQTQSPYVTHIQQQHSSQSYHHPSILFNPSDISEEMRYAFQLSTSTVPAAISVSTSKFLLITPPSSLLSANNKSTSTSPQKIAQFELSLQHRKHSFFENPFDWNHRQDGLSAVADLFFINLGDFQDPSKNILLSDCLKKPTNRGVFETIATIKAFRGSISEIEALSLLKKPSKPTPLMSNSPQQRPLTEQIVSEFNLFLQSPEKLKEQQTPTYSNQDETDSVLSVPRFSLTSDSHVSPVSPTSIEYTLALNESNSSSHSSPMQDRPELEAHYTCVKFVKNGDLIAVGRSDGVLELYDVNNLSVSPPLLTFVGKVSSSAITCMASNANLLAIGSLSSDVVILDLKNSLDISVISVLDSQNQSAIVSLEWNPFSESSLAATTSLGYINLYNIISSDQHAIREIRTSEYSVKALAWHPTQRNYLITGGLDGEIKVFDFNTNKIMATKTIHEHVYKIVFSPSQPDKFLALTGYTSAKHQQTIVNNPCTILTQQEIIEDPAYSQAARISILSFPDINKITSIDISSNKSSDVFLSADYSTAYIYSRDNQLSAWKIFEEETHHNNRELPSGDSLLSASMPFDPR